MQEREVDKKKPLFLTNWKEGFLCFKFVLFKQYTHVSHILHISIQLNSKTNIKVQNVTRVIV